MIVVAAVRLARVVIVGTDVEMIDLMPVLRNLVTTDVTPVMMAVINVVDMVEGHLMVAVPHIPDRLAFLAFHQRYRFHQRAGSSILQLLQ